jgi:hypothetical protein
MTREKFLSYLILFCAPIFPIWSDDIFYNDTTYQLYHDLETVEKVDKKINDDLVIISNYMMQGGYFTMPSARMAKNGDFGLAGAYVPPYRILSASFQYFSRIELSANYWIFHGIYEGNFGHEGFGYDAERISNIKIALLKKDDGLDFVPEIAVGMNDFLGTKRFQSKYIVATKTFTDYLFEISIGYGTGRIKGFFGGIGWSPFHKLSSPFKELTFIAEYDANNYKHHYHEHYASRKVNFPINVGFQYKIYDTLRISASSIRGDDFAASFSFNYNFGETKGLFSKYLDTLLYTTPKNSAPIGQDRKTEEFAQELAYAFRAQGFDLYEIFLRLDDNNRKQLWMKIVNIKYRTEPSLRERIEHVLQSLLPSDIHSVEVVIESETLACQEYLFLQEDLKKHEAGKINDYELTLLSPLKEASSTPSSFDASLIYKRKRKVWTATIMPALHTYFGSTKGKLKYDAGFLAGLSGYVFSDIFYSIQASYIVLSNNKDVGDKDRYSPSQMLNVRTDIVRYYQANTFHIEEAYLQKCFNLSNGWYASLSAGYYEVALAGFNFELLYFPVSANWAIGCEAAPIWKRDYRGIGIAHTIRKLHGITPEYVHYKVLYQYFLNLYYCFDPLSLEIKISAGQFLARDKGVRFDLTRHFNSGLDVGFWVTLTNGRDTIGGRSYFDKGFFLSIPFDFFLAKSSKTRINYAMSAWLRDMGAKVNGGRALYPLIYDERRKY